MKDEYFVISEGENIILRDGVSSDIERYINWWDEGEWQKYDAPWEVKDKDMSEKKRRKLFKELYIKNKRSPRKRALISTTDGTPIGWVNRYQDRKDLDFWYIGIDICEDQYLGKGLGTEALELWIDYLFENSNIHKIALRTYSFNIRMKRVAEKLGFVEEGVEREIKRWEGRYIDLVDYGLLRREWKG
ncbi:MAG: GNAT family N-acetyltransferase [Candidatus Saliniplasma sp.]